MTHVFIVNPQAGKGREAEALTEKIDGACAASGVRYEIYRTTARGDASRFAAERILKKSPGETLRFYACGGDGTLGEVVSGVLTAGGGERSPEGVEVGCVPIGTRNDFVRCFTNTAFFLDITKQLLADPVQIDCFAVNDRFSVNMVNIGFDCDVVLKAAELKKKRFLPKGLAYLIGLVVILKENPGKMIRVIRPDGQEETREFELCAVANGGFCGGGFHSAPKSLLDDGLLDISLIRKVSRLTFLRLVGAYRRGRHLETKLGRAIVDYKQARAIRFEFDGTTNVCIDGEIVPMDSIDFKAMPGALSFAVPVGTMCSVLREKPGSSL